MFQLTHKIMQIVVGTLFPNLCPSCMKPMESSTLHLCMGCEMALPLTDDFEVPYNDVRRKFTGRLPLICGGALMVFNEQGMAQKIVHDFKYYGNRDLAHYMGILLGKAIQKAKLSSGIDVVIPVPMHSVKQKRRGYNQANEIAKGVAEVLECKFIGDIVEKTSHSGSQTFLNRIQRWQNVSQAFKVIPSRAHELENLHVLLVDDTLTTGATLESLGRTILGVCSCHISVATIAAVE